MFQANLFVEESFQFIYDELTLNKWEEPRTPYLPLKEHCTYYDGKTGIFCVNYIQKEIAAASLKILYQVISDTSQTTHRQNNNSIYKNYLVILPVQRKKKTRISSVTLHS